MKKTKISSLRTQLEKLASKAKKASYRLGVLESEKKNFLLLAMAQALLREKEKILIANAKDLKKARQKGLSGAFIERLSLSEGRIEEMALSLRQIAGLNDPVGGVISSSRRPNGLELTKVRVPIGVILIIYESRPNVTSDCIGLCLKSGNAVILRGGSDALQTNTAIYKILERTLQDNEMPQGIVNFVPMADRSAVDVLLTIDDSIDLVMPRGGESLIREVRDKSKIPVIKHYKGVCHIFVDKSADFMMAQRIVLNAKVQRAAVCNAVETLLVAEEVARDFLPTMIESLQDARVQVRGCAKTRKIVSGLKAATDEDWSTEYLDLILSVKIVKDVEEAIAHINQYGSRHSDSIITQDQNRADRFLKGVDASCVYVNASTRFTDGFQFGMGAEIGISTDKIHARGPMGLEELTTYKYMIRGSGQIRE